MIVVMVERSLALGGGRTRVRLFSGASVIGLKQAIHRQCAIAPAAHTLLLHNNNLEPLDHDEQHLDAVGISDCSSVLVDLQGTLASFLLLISPVFSSLLSGGICTIGWNRIGLRNLDFDLALTLTI